MKRVLCDDNTARVVVLFKARLGIVFFLVVVVVVVIVVVAVVGVVPTAPSIMSTDGSLFSFSSQAVRVRLLFFFFC